jgi:hypothetical protein
MDSSYIDIGSYTSIIFIFTVWFFTDWALSLQGPQLCLIVALGPYNLF